MPNYEYECTSCGHRFERSQGMNDPPLKKCPECGEKVRRLISGGGGVIFKGSGFHATDYPKSGTCCSSGQQCDQPKRCCGE
jgi:putative FmdB family regulatory protein